MTDSIVGLLVLLWLTGYLTGLVFRFVISLMHRSTRT